MGREEGCYLVLSLLTLAYVGLSSVHSGWPFHFFLKPWPSLSSSTQRDSQPISVSDGVCFVECYVSVSDGRCFGEY